MNGSSGDTQQHYHYYHTTTDHHPQTAGYMPSSSSPDAQVMGVRASSIDESEDYMKMLLESSRRQEQLLSRVVELFTTTNAKLDILSTKVELLQSATVDAIKSAGGVPAAPSGRRSSAGGGGSHRNAADGNSRGQIIMPPGMVGHGTSSNAPRQGTMQPAPPPPPPASSGIDDEERRRRQAELDRLRQEEERKKMEEQKRINEERLRREEEERVRREALAKRTHGLMSGLTAGDTPADGPVVSSSSPTGGLFGDDDDHAAEPTPSRANNSRGNHRRPVASGLFDD
ncbi:hypothetical protein FOZ60_009918 [Perkinsus olseni]|uniref:Uncharacterized protein n=1 Tax=Perkinsus olseni TaxID=32597 RepID=A0A7J6PMC8_PEROL|nr:hypothetical protein FOZ60_009918 [Perkinsus olseni]